MRRISLVVAVSGLLIVVAITSYMALTSTSYLEVSQLERYVKPTKISVMGNVVPGSVRYKEGLLHFEVGDDVYRVKINYNGFVQLDNRTSDTKALVYGVYYPSEKLIIASQVLISCPSREEAEPSA